MKFIWFVAFVCVCPCVHMCHTMHVKVRRQLAGVNFPSTMRVSELKLTLDDKLISLAQRNV